MKLLAILLLSIIPLFALLRSEENKTYKVHVDSKGVKTFYNRNKPADPDFNIKLKKITEINSVSIIDSLEINKNRISIWDFDIDKDGNIIILDLNLMWKFDRNGQFLNKWSRSGYGPGEIVNPFNFFMLNDSIYVNNTTTRKVVKFNSQGKFIHDIYIDNPIDFPEDIFFAGGDVLLGRASKGSYGTTIDRISEYDSKTLKVKKTLFEKKYKKTPREIMNDIKKFIYAGDEKVFFVVDNSFNDYKINCYDSKTGKLKYKIRKSHLKVDNDQKVEKHYAVAGGKEIEMKSGTNKFKESINAIFYDKYDRLWVNANRREKGDDNRLYFDIFKDGIFINRIAPNLEYGYIPRFRLSDNKIIEYCNSIYMYEFE